MFSKISLLATSLLVTLAVADYPPPPPGTINMCCVDVGDANDPMIQQVAGPAGINLLNFPGPGLFGIGCSAIVVVSNPCPNTVNGPDIFAVNCDIDDLNEGLIYTGCFPIPF